MSYGINDEAYDALQSHVDAVMQRLLTLIDDHCVTANLQPVDGSSPRLGLMSMLGGQLFALAIEEAIDAGDDEFTDEEREQAIKAIFHVLVEKYLAQRKLVRFPGERRPTNRTTH